MSDEEDIFGDDGSVHHEPIVDVIDDEDAIGSVPSIEMSEEDAEEVDNENKEDDEGRLKACCSSVLLKMLMRLTESIGKSRSHNWLSKR